MFIVKYYVSIINVLYNKFLSNDMEHIILATTPFHWLTDKKKKGFTFHPFNCLVHLTFDNKTNACNWSSEGSAYQDGNLLV